MFIARLLLNYPYHITR